MSLSKIQQIFDSERGTTRLNQKFGPINFADKHGTTTVYATNGYFGLCGELTLRLLQKDGGAASLF